METIPQAVVAVAAGREATQQCASLTQPIYTAARSKLREDVTICYQDLAFALSFAELCRILLLKVSIADALQRDAWTSLAGVDGTKLRSV